MRLFIIRGNPQPCQSVAKVAPVNLSRGSSVEIMLEHLRTGDSIEKFKEVLVKRHGKKILEEYYSNY